MARMSDTRTGETFPPITLDDVRRAATNIAPHLSLPTPLVYSPGLSELLDAHVSLKLETATPISVFKVRGGIHLLIEMSDEERASGVVTASTGNHAQSIAYAAGLLNVDAQICMPENANPDKVASVERLGATALLGGHDFDEARLRAGEIAAEQGRRFIHSSDEPDLIAGVGTAALEVLESQQPETDLVIVPAGGGSGVCGWLAVRDGLDHEAEIWASQSAQAPAMHDSWRAAQLIERPNTTVAEGLSTGVPFELPFQILQRSLDDFILVDDEEIIAAVGLLLERAHVLAEPAGAASTAAAVNQSNRLKGRTVVLVVSGANITRDQLKAWL